MSPGRVVTYDLGPPVLVPLAMAGLGLLGVILCAQKHYPVKSEDYDQETQTTQAPINRQNPEETSLKVEINSIF
jgi:hypothetical protein